MSYFPFFTDISDQEGLIIGGGTVALRKAKTFLAYGAKITIIAPTISNECRELPVTIVEREFRGEDINERWAFVIAAADNRDINIAAAALCKARRIPVNIVNAPEEGTFVVPALLSRGMLSVGVCTSGASPTAAAWLRDRVSESIPDDFEELLEKLSKHREWLLKHEPDRKKRTEILKQLFYDSLENDKSLTKEERGGIES